MPDILARIGELRAARTSCVLATVVASYPPQSVRAGAKAIIFLDGTIEGWIGGGCIRPVVLAEARDVLATGVPRLVRMNAGAARVEGRGTRDYPMTCQGEGGVEIYLEAMLPAPSLSVLGDTPVANALVRLAAEVGYRVTATPADAEAVVVATMGVGDEEALAAAAASSASYVGLVASRKKAGFLFDFLRASGVPNEQLARVKAPAGLDLGGMAPEEIALSIMAEIVQRRRTVGGERGTGDGGRGTGNSERSVDWVRDSSSASPPDQPFRSEPPVPSSPFPVPSAPSTAIDPICGMTVDVATAKHVLEIGGETFYFCCPHCKARFAKAHA